MSTNKMVGVHRWHTVWVEGDEILRRVDGKSVDKLARIGKWEARMGGNGKWGNRRTWL